MQLGFHVKALLAELARKQANNPRYSMRAFANHLGIHPSALSRILRGKQTLTTQSACLALPKMTLSEDEKLAFAASLARDAVAQVCNELAPAIGRKYTVEELAPMIQTPAPAPQPEKKTSSFDLALYRNIADFIPHAAWVVEQDGRIAYANEIASAYGTGKASFEDCLHDGDQAAFRALLAKHLDLPRAFEVQCRLAGAAGDSLHALRLMPVTNAYGRVSAWLATAFASEAASTTGAAES